MLITIANAIHVANVGLVSDQYCIVINIVPEVGNIGSFWPLSPILVLGIVPRY